jgi:hypothetical protein
MGAQSAKDTVVRKIGFFFWKTWNSNVPPVVPNEKRELTLEVNLG